MLCLSRQNLKQVRNDGEMLCGVSSIRGAYRLKAADAARKVVLVATGSEVEIALDTAAELEAQGFGADVVSMPCMELFAAQDAAYRADLLPADTLKVSIEAGATLADATLIIEVLSPSTQSYDRGEKFLYYRGLPSFAEYLLLSQDAIRAEHHTRQPDGSWLLREISDPGAILQLTSIGCQLPLAELYERVQLETTLPLNPAALLAPAM